ncbi:MAG: arginine--tRNA ligase, partial [Oscillospiraceae bacterium]|nr:arginine--tRNA ligase [Oscillospiraceae bacterium]
MNLIKKASEQLNQIIIDAINKGIANGELKEGTLNPFNIEIPADKSHGDFATNAAMTNVKVFGLPPRKIAEIIVANADCKGSYIAELSIAGPGFINAKISPNWFGDVLCAVQDEKQDYGRTTDAPKQKIMVEFVSANPTGPMHIGNARGGAIGDCLASVLDWAGNDVTREFYVNDAGNQIEKFAVSLEARYLQIFKGDEIEFPEDAYHGEDIKVHAKNFADINGDKFVDASSDERKKALVEFALPKNVENLKTDLEKYRIYYDVWFKESQLHQQAESIDPKENIAKA